ncbi:MAG: AmmeMemoRadiSam system protein A [Desulfomonilia bacterium]
MQSRISEQEGQALVRLARKTIENYLGLQASGGEAAPEPPESEELRKPRGVFVTLHKKGRLRGCIGYLEAREPVVEAVKDNALNAAFRDPRFSPVMPSELPDLDIEVSVLTEPRPLQYAGVRDLLEKLRPGVDGVIIRKGFSSATFLPQVWEQLPDGREFLGQLCLKAGLPADAWMRGDLEVLTYQVQCFEEKRR